jgi:hypothetical protein
LALVEAGGLVVHVAHDEKIAGTVVIGRV